MSSRSATAYPEVEGETSDQLQPLYHVILLNDDDHTYDYVIEMLQKIFGFSESKAFSHAVEVDTKGTTILLTFDSEFQIVGNVDGQNDADAGHLVLAGGARTHTSKNGREMMRLVPIGPSDHQLSRMDLLYLRRSACLGTGHFPGYSTSSTGASKVRILT